MSDGFSEAESLEWVTIQICPAPPGMMIRVGETEVPCPVFLLQEARSVIAISADEHGVGDRQFEELEPPFDTRVVPGVFVEYECGHQEIEPSVAVIHE